MDALDQLPPPVLPDDYIEVPEFCRRLKVSASWFDRNGVGLPGVIHLTRKCVRIHWPTFQEAALRGDITVHKTNKQKRPHERTHKNTR